MENCYEILGLDNNATMLETKKTYRNLAKKYHPDLNKNIGAKERFIEIKEAYKNLMNPTAPKGFLGFLEIWEDLITENDFNVPRWGRFIDSEEYDKYRWAKNKIKLLSKLYYKISNEYNRTIIEDLVGLDVIINHFNKVLNGEIGIKDKITKSDDMKLKFIPMVLNSFYEIDMRCYGHSKQPEYRPKYYDLAIKKIKKLIFDIQNQFHPKFINKFHWRIQLFLHNKIRELIIYLQSNNKKERGE